MYECQQGGSAGVLSSGCCGGTEQGGEAACQLGKGLVKCFFSVFCQSVQKPLDSYLGEEYSYKQVNRELFLAC